MTEISHRKRSFAQVLAGLLLCSPWATAQQAATADYIFLNGNVLTVDNDEGEFSIAQAIAVQDGYILAVGTNDRVRQLAGPETRRVDLAGKTVLPGLIDTHTHPTQYAGYRTAPEVAPEIAATHMIEGPRLNGDIKDSLRVTMQQLEARVRTDLRTPATQRPWLSYLLRSSPGDADYHFFKAFDRYDLDRLSPDRPMLVDADGNYMVNSAGLEALLEVLPLANLDPELDARGEPTGRLGGGVRSIVAAVVPDISREFFPGKNRIPYERRIDLLARSLELELRQHWARYGITTIASKLDAEEFAALTRLDRAGEMPVRWAYHIESFRHPVSAELIAQQMPNYEGLGSPHLWMAGIYGGSADTQCTTLESTRKELENCNLKPGSDLWRSLFPAVRNGFRISGFHVHGDLAVDHVLLLIEQASAAGGMTLEDIRAKRHVLDHCSINPRPDQIARGKRLGVNWTCGPKYIIRAQIDAEGYDVEAVSQWVVPYRSLIDAGLMPGFHTDGDQGGPMVFKYMEVAITRQDLEGRSWNIAEAIDRKDILRAATRWNAANILRGEQLGSIEAGKWADLIVIDRDYMTIPVREIPDIRVLVTMVGGKILYKAAEIEI